LSWSHRHSPTSHQSNEASSYNGNADDQPEPESEIAHSYVADASEAPS
jgi:hypothetical protein